MTDDYALTPVPKENSVSALRIVMVCVGIIVALPAFILGAELGSAHGFRIGALAIFLGGGFLSVIAMATGTVGANTRLNTAMLTKRTFGSIGGRLVSVILALTMLGWFGVTAELFGRGVHEVMTRLGWSAMPEEINLVIGGLLMTGTTVLGFAALQRLSNITVPLLAALIAWTAWLTLRQKGADALWVSGLSPPTLGDGISAIVGGLSVAVTIFPDLSRFCRSAKDARIAAFMTYGVAMPTVLLLAMIPSVLTQQRDLIIIMVTVGLGAPALVLLIMKAWATNAGNLYSAALSAANSLGVRSQRSVVIMGGCVGTLLAVAGISQAFIPFLIILGICIPPIAGIYVADFFSQQHQGKFNLPAVGSFNYVAFACWFLGIGIAIAGQMSMLSFTSIPSADSILIAAGSFLFTQRLRRWRGERKKAQA